MVEIRHKRFECIGCCLCAEQAPDYWKMTPDGLATLCQIKKHYKRHYYTEGWDHDYNRLKIIADACPVNIISVSK
mgnify:FL=1